MKPLHILVLSCFLPLAAWAQDAPLQTVAASDIALADILYLKRPIVVFADSPNDPEYVRQIELLTQAPGPLAERDIIVITDTDPAARTAIRQKLRPRGFSLVLMDKDGSPQIRKPLPWDVREITNAIDKFPMARLEALEKHPSGR